MKLLEVVHEHVSREISLWPTRKPDLEKTDEEEKPLSKARLMIFFIVRVFPSSAHFWRRLAYFLSLPESAYGSMPSI
jgi:hypothetical protein